MEAEFGVMCSSKPRNTVSYQKLLRVKEQIDFPPRPAEGTWISDFSP